MPKTENFIGNFKKDHRELTSLITDFKEAVKASDINKARIIMAKIEFIAGGHFDFEETYLYPRLRRLISEITENFCSNQKQIKDFITRSKKALSKKSSQEELKPLLNELPGMLKYFKDCDDLTILTEKFRKEDIEDLNRRFEESSLLKNLPCA